MSWKKIRLADIVSMRTGKLDSNASVPNGEYPFFTCSQQTLRINEYAFDTEAVLLGGNNATGVFPLKYYCGQFNAYQRTYVIESLDQTLLKTHFLYYALKPALLHFQAVSIGAATQYLTKSILDNFQVSLPPIQEQQRIIDVLAAYDELIENNQRRIQLLEQFIHLLYREWFVNFHFPGHEHVKIIDSVPEGWEQMTIPDIIKINPRESVQKNSDIRYIPMSSLSESGMTVDMSDTEIRQKATAVKFRNDDTLLARITPCLENGKTGFVNFLMEGEVACGSTEFIVLRGHKVSPYFVYCLARTHDFRGKAIKSMIGSSGRQRVQKNCFDDFVLGLPPKQLLLQFDDVASNCFKQISNLMRQNEQLRKAGNFILPRLMNGEIAVERNCLHKAVYNLGSSSSSDNGDSIRVEIDGFPDEN